MAKLFGWEIIDFLIFFHWCPVKNQRFFATLPMTEFYWLFKKEIPRCVRNDTLHFKGGVGEGGGGAATPSLSHTHYQSLLSFRLERSGMRNLIFNRIINQRISFVRQDIKR